MGLDLRLLPAYTQNADWMSHDILGLDRDDDILNAVFEFEKKHGIEVKRGGFKSFLSREDGGETKYGSTETTPYGDRIKSVLAIELSKVFESVEISGWKNKAIVAFVKELPDDLPIYLYWH